MDVRAARLDRELRTAVSSREGRATKAPPSYAGGDPGMTNVTRALVTGGAGFIGSHLVDELVERGIETWVLDNLSTGSIDNLRRNSGSKLLHLCVGEVGRIDRLPNDLGAVDVVFHEAAIVSAPESVAHPMAVHGVNVNAMLELMNFCVKRGVKRIVFASSAAVYGSIRKPPASESDFCAPSTPYGASKLSGEGYLNAYHKSYGLETVILRYFNAYGPRQRMNDDYSGVMTIFAKRLMQRKTPTIFGDGQQTRDFVNVADIVQANMLAMESKAAVGETFNVASGNSITILELLQVLQSVTGVTVQPRFLPPRPGDDRIGVASISKISSLLGYKPRVPLSRGLASFVDQMRTQHAELLVA